MRPDPRRPIRFRPSQLLTFGPPKVEQLPLFEEPQEPLRLILKRHRATTLHTDWRFELFGILFSLVAWEHPSLDPRRAIRLREMPDHDPAYANSERRIPDGMYGAGAMLVWELATLVPIGCVDGRYAEFALAALLRGRFDFRLDGKRLRGAFRLEMRGASWWLSKLEDEYATSDPVAWDEYSIITGRSLEDIEAEYRRLNPGG